MSDIKWKWGGRGPKRKFKHSRAELSIASRVSISGEVLKPSRLNDELVEDRPNRLWPQPHAPTSTSCPPDLTRVLNSPRPSLFYAALPLPCVIVNANQRDKTNKKTEQNKTKKTGVDLGKRLQS